MIVKNLILHNNFQRLLSKYFKQKHLPPPIINELRGFLYLLYRESDDWFNLPYPLFLFLFSFIETQEFWRWHHPLLRIGWSGDISV